jgi:hypothetical protein
MESKQIRIRFLQDRKYNGIILSQGLCKDLGLESQKQIYIQFGQKKVLSRIIKTQKSEKDLWLPETIRKQLEMPFSGSLRATVNGNTLRIGPVIGILTTGIRTIENQVVSKRAYFFKHLLSAQKGEPLYYYLFTPEDVDWSTKTVQGLFWYEDGSTSGWRRARVPFPDVIYNRIPDRYTERQEEIKRFINKLEKETEAKMFNAFFFNKWAIHQSLEGHPVIGEHIPETYIAPNTEMIQTMLQKHRMIYLKPIFGSLGLGIYKITDQGEKGYFCRYNDKGKNILKRYKNISSFLKEHFTSHRLQRYVVQQGIQLVKYDKRPLDFRVHVHKNHENKWVVAAVAAKIAGQGSVTTHVRTGGTVLSGKDLLKIVFPQYGYFLEEKVRDTAIKLAEAIEAKVDPNVGEIGFDIGIDANEKIWMFEANSRPGRSIFKYTSLKEADKKSLHLILDYSLYLANFK